MTNRSTPRACVRSSSAASGALAARPASPPASRVAIRAAFAMASAVAVLQPIAAVAQMAGPPRALGWAVPEAERPAELKGARDVVSVDGVALRLRTELWLPARDCPPKRKDPSCAPTEGLAGRVYVGGLWEDKPLPGYEIESLWLLRKGAVWQAPVLDRRSDLQVAFADGPVWPTMEPLDVVVRLKGVEGLLQLQYRTPYLRGR